ncbi:Complement component C8 alpha chain, partial [Ophiophagus hannah]
ENRNSIAYRYWGRSLKLNPTIIDFELQPIYELLSRTSLGNMETKRTNLKRALYQYLMEFNTCRCGPCKNNGEPILLGATCVCECKQGYLGPDCGETEKSEYEYLGYSPIEDIEDYCDSEPGSAQLTVQVIQPKVAGVAGLHGQLVKGDLEAAQDSVQTHLLKMVEQHAQAGIPRQRCVNN